MISFSLNVKRDQLLEPGGTAYGKFAVTLNKEYSRQEGWVTPYVMTGRDITRFQEASGIKDASQLHLFDFTVSDFEAIIRIRLLMTLAELHSKNSSEYSTVLNSIQNGTFIYYLENLVWKKLGFRGDAVFEVRIPYALPREHFQIVPTQ